MGPTARLVELIEVEVTEGMGTETSPKRRVTYWLTKEGVCVARTDRWEEEKAESEGAPR